MQTPRKPLISAVRRRALVLFWLLAGLRILAPMNSRSAGFFDAGGVAPTVGSNDIAQLTVGSGEPPGLNYYVNNNPLPGQTFTTGGTALVAGGFPLTSLYVNEQGGTSGGGMPQPSAYTLRIYQVAGTNVTLLTSYVSTNTMVYAEGDWMAWTGLTNILQTNTTYAFSLQAGASGWWELNNNSGNPCAGGESVLLPTGNGHATLSSNTNYDAAFDVKFDNSAIVINTQPAGQVLTTGSPFAISVAASGQAPLDYQWEQNGTPIANATNATYSVASAGVTNAGSFTVVVSNSLNSVVSMPAAVVVLNLSDETNESGMVCELLEHPEETVITAQTPKFGWVYYPSFRGDSQTGYRIIVASTLANASATNGDMWDSGIVSSSNSLNVPFGGAALQTNTAYFWRVQTVNSLGQAGAFSGYQQFNTGAHLFNAVTTPGVVYQRPANGSTNCYPIRFVAAAPVLLTNTAPGVWFVDFGQDAFGYATVHLNGSYSGQVVTAQFGELSTNGPSVDSTPPGGSCVRYATSTVTLQNGNMVYPVRPPSFNGNPDSQTISPPAAFGVVMPFRYFEVTNFPGTLTVTDVVQERLVSEFDTNAATFNSSSTALNQVWNLCRNSMQWLSFDGIYVDGDRERTPYEADTYIHMLGSYGVNNDFTMPRCTFEYLTNHLTWPTEWPMHMVFNAWADYQQTGDTYLMTKYYGFLTNSCILASRFNASSGLVDSFPVTGNSASGDIIDWYRIGNTDGYVAEATNAVINAFYYRCMVIMSNMAQLTGHTADAATFGARASQVYSAYNSTFWNPVTQSYFDGVGTTDSSAHANFFPLAFGLVPASNQTAVVNYIHSRIAANGGMPPGVYGAQYMLQALFQANDSDIALGLITTNGSRSWMNMLDIGSSLTDEAWNIPNKSNEDWNHAWGAAPGNLIPRYVLGLLPVTAGYSQVVIQPQLGQTLSFVQGTIPTIRGPVSIFASNAPPEFQLLVNIPGNVTATVMVPATNTTAIVDGAVVTGSLSNNWLTVSNIGSGQHAIWSSSTSSPSLTTLYGNWASEYFGTNATNPAVAGETADPDGDGVDNFNEFVAGTDPTNPQSVFQVTSVTDTNVPTVTVAGVAGRYYTLMESTSLTPPSWTPVATSSVLTSNQVVQLQDNTAPGGQAYYRVQVALP